MFKCDRCNEYKFKDSCDCELFIVIDDEGEEHDIYSHDEESAARKFAEWTNEYGDYHLMDNTMIISINDKKFNIGAEPDIYYFANEIEKTSD